MTKSKMKLKPIAPESRIEVMQRERTERYLKRNALVKNTVDDIVNRLTDCDVKVIDDAVYVMDDIDTMLMGNTMSKKEAEHLKFKLRTAINYFARKCSCEKNY